MNGNDKLISDLEEELDRTTDKTKRAAVEMMLSRARTGFYGDFTSPIATPKLRLIMDAKGLHLNDIASKTMEGKYDG